MSDEKDPTLLDVLKRVVEELETLDKTCRIQVLQNRNFTEVDPVILAAAHAAIKKAENEIVVNVDALTAGSDMSETQWRKENETFTYWKLSVDLIFYVHVDERGTGYEYIQTGCISPELYEEELERLPQEGWTEL